MVPSALVVLLYAAGSWWLVARLGLADARHLPGCACGDQASEVWFLAYWKYWIFHGALPFATKQLNYPVGFGVVDNASMPLLGVLMAPVTALFGPVASYAVLVRLGLVVSAASGFFVLRRLGRGRLAAAVGGAFYGFSPFMTHQAASHVFLTFVPLPPLILLLVFTLASHDRPTRPFRFGVLLGALCAAQFYIDSELLVATVLLAVVVGAGFAARPGRLRTGAPRLGRAVLGIAAVALPALSYPLWMAIAGPGHVTGPTQDVGAPGVSALATVFPSTRQLMAARLETVKPAASPLLGDLGFIGPLLLVVVVVGAISGRCERWVRAVTALGVTAWVLSLGAHLDGGGWLSSLPLPFWVFTHIPMLQDLIPSRLTLFTYLAAAALLAVAVDRLVVPAVRATPDIRSRARAVGVGCLAGIGCLATLPAAPIPVTGIGVAAWFRSDAVSDEIPTGGVAISYPIATFPDDRAMIWQAETGLQFSLVGGYVIHPGVGGHESRDPSLLSPAGVESLLLHIRDSRSPAATRRAVRAARGALKTFVHRYRVTTLLVSTEVVGWRQVAALFQQVYGAPWQRGRLLMWDLARRSPPPT